ncbi:hypothetical protein ACWGID_23710 [Kribbella sp. NPDC054772]
MAAVEEFEDAYERAEADYLRALRADRPRADLTLLAGAVAGAAEAWDAEAYRLLHLSVGSERAELDRLTEMTEALRYLWTDIHAAYRG